MVRLPPAIARRALWVSRPPVPVVELEAGRYQVTYFPLSTGLP